MPARTAAGAGVPPPTRRGPTGVNAWRTATTPPRVGARRLSSAISLVLDCREPRKDPACDAGPHPDGTTGPDPDPNPYLAGDRHADAILSVSLQDEPDLGPPPPGRPRFARVPGR
jgi:hypothetical protein